MKKLIVLTIAGFIFLSLFDFLFHGIYMKDIYMATADQWRTVAEMQQYNWLGYLTNFIYALLFAGIAARHTNMSNGIIYTGLGVGLFLGISMASSFIYMPIPAILSIKWLIGVTLEWTLLGVLINAINQKM